MADPERFKRQSPVTTRYLPAVKCKRHFSDFGLSTEKKRLQPDPCKNKDTYC